MGLQTTHCPPANDTSGRLVRLESGRTFEGSGEVFEKVVRVEAGVRRRMVVVLGLV